MKKKFSAEMKMLVWTENVHIKWKGLYKLKNILLNEKIGLNWKVQ